MHGMIISTSKMFQQFRTQPQFASCPSVATVIATRVGKLCLVQFKASKSIKVQLNSGNLSATSGTETNFVCSCQGYNVLEILEKSRLMTL